MLIAMMCIATYVPVTSCSKQPNKSSDEGEFLEETANSQHALTLVPIFNQENPARLEYVALKNSNGEFVMFDNENDYSDMCYVFYFLGQASHELQKPFEEQCELFYELLDGVILFTQGKKNEIKDKEVLTAIEKAYYNRVSGVSSEYTITKQRYGFKDYYPINGRGYIWSYAYHEGKYPYANINDAFLVMNQDVIPEGAIIFNL